MLLAIGVEDWNGCVCINNTKYFWKSDMRLLKKPECLMENVLEKDVKIKK